MAFGRQGHRRPSGRHAQVRARITKRMFAPGKALKAARAQDVKRGKEIIAKRKRDAEKNKS